MTGIKPTGQYHIGSLITCKEVLYFQNLGGKVYFCIADMEAYLHSGVPLKAVNEFFPNKVKWFRDLTSTSMMIHLLVVTKKSATL